MNHLRTHWKHVVSLFLISISVSASLLLAPSTRPANAIFGLGDITLVNLDDFAKYLLLGILETLTEGVVKQVASKAINSTISQYHIGSYLQYAANLKNQVFAAQAIANDGVAGSSQLNQYLVKSIISDIDTNPVQRVALDPLYQKVALDAFNIQNTNQQQVGAAAQSFMAVGGSFGGNAAGQFLLFTDMAQKINTKAYVAAQQDVQTAGGNKSAYNCTAAATATGTALTNGSGEGLGDAFNDGSDFGNSSQKGASANSSQQLANNNQQVNCLLQNPGAYVGNVLAGNIQGLFNRNFNPPDNNAAILGATVGNAFGAIASQQLVGGSSGGTLVSSTTPSASTSGSAAATSTCNSLTTVCNITGTTAAPPNLGAPTLPTVTSSGSSSSSSSSCYSVCAPGDGATNTNVQYALGSSSGAVLGASTSTYGTLYAVDASGNVIAGSASDVSLPIAKKSTYTLQWNASAVTGARYVAFAPCVSAQCAGKKDQRQLDDSQAEKAAGALQTYTLEVWGTDQYGNLNILETDSIAIKTK